MHRFLRDAVPVEGGGEVVFTILVVGQAVGTGHTDVTELHIAVVRTLKVHFYGVVRVGFGGDGIGGAL